jgi:hypothetical protein
MTHADKASEARANTTRFRPPRLDGLADLDEVLRQLSDLLCVPLGCRRRSCRATERCVGGQGPPCVYEETAVFISHFEARTREVRVFWRRQHLLAAERQARAEGGHGRDEKNLSRGAGEAEPAERAR